MNLSQVYKKSLNKKWLVRFITKHPDGDCYDGIVLKEAKDFIVIASENDFEFDGILILSKKFIKGFRDGKFEKCFNEIIRFNSQIKKIKLPTWLNKCQHIKNIFQEIKNHNIWPLVEIVFNKGKKSDFYIGLILGGNEKEVGVRGYNAMGKWEKEYVLDYNEILRISFNDKYSKHFNNFMKSRK